MVDLKTGDPLPFGTLGVHKVNSNRYEGGKCYMKKSSSWLLVQSPTANSIM